MSVTPHGYEAGSSCQGCCWKTYIPRVAARRLLGHMYADSCEMIPAPEISYAFRRTAIMATPPLIQAPWANHQVLVPGEHVYIRTEEAAYVLNVGTLEKLIDHLEHPAWLFRLSKSVFVNLHKVTVPDFDGQLARVGVTVTDNSLHRPAGSGSSQRWNTTEWLTVSRRRQHVLRKVLLLPHREKKPFPEADPRTRSTNRIAGS